MREYSDIAEFLPYLIYFGKQGALRKPFITTTSEIGNQLGISQQTISRKLIKMEKENLIVRKYSAGGNSIIITTYGKNLLERIFSDLWIILTAEGIEKRETLSIKGKVVTGMGEGAYYMSLAGYKHQFTSILGFVPFPGTLNLQILQEPYLTNFEKLIRIKTKFASSFYHEGRKFGKVFVWPTYLIIKDRKIPSAIIRPDRTHHHSQIEIIAEQNIKKVFGVKDGDELEVVLRS